MAVVCGIAGVVGLSAADGIATVRRMTDAIRHRGPDDQGDFAVDNVAFGMRRLSIIDLAQGHQPIWTERGTGIVFNGEIYNYRELRRSLEQRGHRFQTQSDTEVVAKLYDQEGLACLDRLEGMFAICLYDPVACLLHLVRDRIGKKPLYLGEIGGVFYFASEIKAILAVLDRRPALNSQAMYDYLSLRYVPGPDSIWRGISKLEPGTSLTLDLAKRTSVTRKYWSLAFQSQATESGRDYPAEFEQQFLGAVQKRLVAADVPVGILLSGGLDSSAVAAAAVELGHRAFHTYSVAFADGGEFDETPYARMMAQRLGARHAEVVIDQQQFLNFLPDFVRATDEPLADLASIPLYYVSRLARQDVKVVLSGEGADETLAGYDMAALAQRLDWLWPLRHIPRSLLAMAAKISPVSRKTLLLALSKGGWSGALAERGSHITDDWSNNEKAVLWPRIPRLDPTERLVRSWYAESPSPHPLDQLQQVYCRSWLVEDLLMKADKMSMANSLELRCPFLDHKLIEWCERLPLEWKVGSQAAGYSSKRILRNFASPRLPAKIIDQPKRGFPVPAYQWLEGPLGAWAEDRLLHGGKMKNLFQVAPIATVMASARQGMRTAQHKVWNLLILDHWLEAFT